MITSRMTRRFLKFFLIQSIIKGLRTEKVIDRDFMIDEYPLAFFPNGYVGWTLGPFALTVVG